MYAIVKVTVKQYIHVSSILLAFIIKHICLQILGFNSNKTYKQYAKDNHILMSWKLKFVLIQTN